MDHLNKADAGTDPLQSLIFLGLIPNLHFLLPVAIILLIWSLKNRKASKETVDAFFNDFDVGGHRGSPTKCPENTMESMRQARLDGACLVEFDVSLTKDGVAVLLHDDTLDRTTNFSGPIRDYLHSDLIACDPGAKFCVNGSIAGSGQTYALPTLDELIEWAREHRMKLLFDVKDSDQALILKLRSLFAQHPQLYETSIVCSFFPSVVYKIKRHDPKILTGLTWRRWFISHKDIQAERPRFQSALAHALAIVIDVAFVWSIHRWLPSFLGVELILTERSEISESFVAHHKARGRKVCAWTVNDRNEMNWMKQHLKIPFLTDYPHLVSPGECPHCRVGEKTAI